MTGLHLLGGVGQVAAAALVGVAVLAWSWRLERSRPRGAWRRACLVVAVGALFLMATRPGRRAPIDHGGALLLTPGAAIAEASPTGGAVLALPGVEAERAERVASAALLARLYPGVGRWRIAGEGLPPWDLARLPGEVVRESPAEPVDGFDRADWRRRIAVGETWTVRGSVVAADVDRAVVRLEGPGGLAAEETLVPPASFELATRPKSEGALLYVLSLEVAGVPLVAERLDVVVESRRPPRVLWLEGSPGFETRHVKNWLTDVGGALVIRTRVSRGRYRYEYLNHERVGAARLDRDLLGRFDLAVIDGPGWSDLAGSERRLLRDAVEDGLGLLVVPPLPPMSIEEAPWRGLAVSPLEGLDTVEARLDGPGLPELAPLTLDARQLVLDASSRPLLRDAAGRPLAALRPVGGGNLVVALVEKSYRWALRGEVESHRRYWSLLLESVARREPEAPPRVPDGPLLLDEPLTVERLGEGSEPPAVTAPGGDRVALPLEQDPLEPRRWRTIFWPRDSGWHELSGGGGFYVAPSDAWRAWRRRRAVESTARREVSGAVAGLAELDAPSRSVPLPRWPLFALALLALAALWADDQWRAAGG